MKILINQNTYKYSYILYTVYSRYELQKTVKIYSPFQEFVLTGALKIEKALKGNKKVRINRNSIYHRVRTNESLLYMILDVSKLICLAAFYF